MSSSASFPLASSGVSVSSETVSVSGGIMEMACAIKATELNPDLGDLELAENGDAVYLTELGASVAQRITVRFNFFLGEWFLDTTEGTPWFQRVLVKAPSDKVIRTVLNSVIANTPGVGTVDQLSYSINSARQLSVTFKATLVDGSQLTSLQYGRFVVDLAGLES